MIFENVNFSIFYVMLFSFLIGFIAFLLVGIVLRKKSLHLSQFKGLNRFLLPSLIFGLSSMFFLTIVVCTLTPSLVTVEKDLSYTEEFSFFSNGEFVGIGGSYIVNNSNRTLKLVGIENDCDINVIIPPNEIKKIRKCPEQFFVEVPKERSKRITKGRRGRRRVVNGPSVFLVEKK